MKPISILAIAFGILLPVLAFGSKSDKTHEIGVFGGVSYYTGELNPNGHFRAGFFHPCIGGTYRKNLNKRWALKATGLYGKVSGNDANVVNEMQKYRALSFTSSIIELSANVEFNFYEFSAADDKGQPLTPYISLGLGAFRFNPKGSYMSISNLDLQSNQVEGANYSKFAACIPLGVGVKFKMNQRFLASVDYGLRKTFTDYIDDVSTVYPSTKMQRGDSQSKDWYGYASVSLCMRLGKKFTSCAFDQGSGRR